MNSPTNSIASHGMARRTDDRCLHHPRRAEPENRSRDSPSRGGVVFLRVPASYFRSVDRSTTFALGRPRRGEGPHHLTHSLTPSHLLSNSTWQPVKNYNAHTNPLERWEGRSRGEGGNFLPLGTLFSTWEDFFFFIFFFEINPTRNERVLLFRVSFSVLFKSGDFSFCCGAKNICTTFCLLMCPSMHLSCGGKSLIVL